MGKVCINQKCVSTTTFVIFVMFALGVMAYTLHVTQQRLQAAANDEPRDSVRDQALLESAAVERTRIRDLDRMINPLVPPTRRSPYGVGPSTIGVPINVPTRGEYGPFQQMGYLQNAAGDKVLRLMGRRIHSNEYEYYTFHPADDKIKVELDQRRELFEGDNVTIDQFGDFKVYLYDPDTPRYVPY